MRKFTSLFLLAMLTIAVNAQESISIKDFIDKADKNTEYQLSGIVTSITNTTYGNLYLKDETEQIYIYGLLTPEGESKKFSTLNVEVNDTLTLKGKYTVYNGTVEISNAIFVSNKKCLDDGVEITTKTIKEVIAAGAGRAQVEGTVVATYTKGFLVKDATGIILVYLNAAHEFSKGDVVTVKGNTAPYAGMLQFSAGSEVNKTGTATVSEPQIEFTGRDMDGMLGTSTIKYGQYTGTLSITSDGYYNVSIPDCQEVIGSISYPASNLINPDWNEHDVTVSGYFIGTSSNKYFNTMVTEITCDDDITPFTVTGDGSKEDPYNVESAIYVSQNDNAEAWVKGYIVGFIPSGSIKDATFTTDCDSVSVSNILIADTKDCTDASKCMPVELKSKSQFRADANIHDNPDNLGKEILVCGEFVNYFKVKGIKNVKEYEIEGLDQHVDALLADDSDAIYFDLTGKRIAKPAKGMCIMQKNGKAVKMIIR